MRILLAQKLQYVPSLTGAAKGDKVLLEGLVRRNHSCRVLALQGANDSGARLLNCNGVEVHALSDSFRMGSYLSQQIENFDPTWILVSEDPTYVLLGAALESAPQRTIFLSHSQATLPFGPESFSPDPKKTRMLERAAGIIACSRYLKEYIRQWGSLEPWWIPYQVYGTGPFPLLASFENPYVTMINPSAIKGLPIFLELARRLPHVQFAGVPTWATTAADRTSMEGLPNVRLLAPDEDIDAIFAKTRVLVVPSLWGEAFGKIVVEAMLRGIPVLASKVGGLPDAKLGIDYVLPVSPIRHYEERRDEKLIKIPIVPAQETGPWIQALDELVSNRARYADLSAASRKAALDYVSPLTVAPVEEYLEALSLEIAQQDQREHLKDDLPQSIKDLPPYRLELLAHLLKNRS